MPPPAPPRRLTSVLFLDVVGSTAVAADLGDRRWREVLGRFNRAIRAELHRFGGREEDTAGDGFFATFPSPEQGLRATDAMVRAVQEIGIDIRCGLHFGECEVSGGKLLGLAMHIGARVMSLAGPAEILVTSTVKDLVAGSKMGFEDLSAHELKGVPGTWQIFAVRSLDGSPVAPPLTGAQAAERLAGVQAAGAGRGRRPALLAGTLAGLAALSIAGFLVLGGGDERAGPHASRTPSRPGPNATPTVLHQALVRLDAASGRVKRTAERVTHGGLGGTRFLAVGEGGVWVTGTGAPLGHLHVDSGRLTQLDEFGDVAVGDGQVWGTGAGGPQGRFYPLALRIDPATDRVVQHKRLPGTFGSISGVHDAVGGGFVWVIYSNRLVRLEESTNDVTVVRMTGSVDTVTAFGDQVWVVDQLAGTLSRIDPQRASVMHTFTLQGISLDSVVVGPAGLWVADLAGGVAASVDEDTGTLGPLVKAGSEPSAVAVGVGAVWVANRGDDTVTRIDPATQQATATFPVPGSPVALGIDRGSGDVWVYLA
jgi:YVTN family beta-propeller protein